MGWSILQDGAADADVCACRTGSLPVQHLDCIEGVNAGFLKGARLLRLFKLFRLTRLATLIKMLEQQFPSSVYVVTFIELFVYFFLVAHWTGGATANVLIARVCSSRCLLQPAHPALPH